MSDPGFLRVARRDEGRRLSAEQVIREIDRAICEFHIRGRTRTTRTLCGLGTRVNKKGEQRTAADGKRAYSGQAASVHAALVHGYSTLCEECKVEWYRRRQP